MTAHGVGIEKGQGTMHIDPRETLQAWMDRGGCGLSDAAVASVVHGAAELDPATIIDVRALRIEDLFLFSRIASREICNFSARQDDPELCTDENVTRASRIAKLSELRLAVAACMPDLEHYVATHGPGPDKRLDRLRAAMDA